MKKGERRKILVVVSGGVVDAVYVSPDLADCDVDCLDFDDLEAAGLSSAQRDYRHSQKTKHMERIQ